MVAKVDENVGRLLGKLKQLGIEADTLLIATWPPRNPKWLR